VSESIRESRVSNHHALVVFAERETVCARKQGIWERSKQLKRSKMVEGHKNQSRGSWIKFSEEVNAVMREEGRGGEGRRARARAVPGFAATLFSGLERCVYESLIYMQQLL
jgi:hypothetical protein